MGRAFALGVPAPDTVTVVATRRTGRSSSLFVSDGMKGADAEALEGAEMAIMAMLCFYKNLYDEFCSRRTIPVDICPDMWASACDLSFHVITKGTAARGSSIGAAVAVAAGSLLSRRPVMPYLGVTGEVSISMCHVCGEAGTYLTVVGGDDRCG